MRTPTVDTVKLKFGEKLWSLNIRTEDIEEVRVYNLKGIKSFDRKPGHWYCVARTITYANEKFKSMLIRWAKKNKPELLDENNSQHSDTAQQD